jgi:hypothetical protein
MTIGQTRAVAAEALQGSPQDAHLGTAPPTHADEPALALIFPEDAGEVLPADRDLRYRLLMDDLDRPEDPDAWPPEGWPTEEWPPIEWLPEAHYNAALWESA